MHNRIFIVEDDPVIVRVVKEHLEQWGFICQAAEDFHQVKQDADEFHADLILLDITLPYHNGFYWCQEFRKDSELPIIFISSANDKMNLVMAINLGADDFIAKPFDLTVLVAKVQALLRRSYQFGAPLSFSFGKYQFNPSENEIANETSRLTLTPNESKILLVLFQNSGQVVSKETLMEKLWESEAFVDSNTLSVNMNRLRKKLATIELRDSIQTIKNKGYRLVAPHEY